jgi:hypothetical protein
VKFPVDPVREILPARATGHKPRKARAAVRFGAFRRSVRRYCALTGSYSPASARQRAEKPARRKVWGFSAGLRTGCARSDHLEARPSTACRPEGADLRRAARRLRTASSLLALNTRVTVRTIRLVRPPRLDITSAESSSDSVPKGPPPKEPKGVRRQCKQHSSTGILRASRPIPCPGTTGRSTGSATDNRRCTDDSSSSTRRPEPDGA